MNMTSRITSDCNAVASHLRTIVHAEKMNLPLHVQRALMNNADILVKLSQDVRKENQEFQEKAYEILTGKKLNETK